MYCVTCYDIVNNTISLITLQTFHDIVYNLCYTVNLTLWYVPSQQIALFYLRLHKIINYISYNMSIYIIVDITRHIVMINYNIFITKPGR